MQALAVDRSGAIYAATSPDGRVYRIVYSPVSATSRTTPLPQETSTSEQVDPNYISSVYFEPKTKYIWALALDRQGRLYVATGDHGEIFRVEKDGKGSVFFKSDDANIRSIALDRDGNLIAGSDGSGLIYRITPAGQGFRALRGAQEGNHRLGARFAQATSTPPATGEKRPSAPPRAAAMPPVLRRLRRDRVLGAPRLAADPATAGARCAAPPPATPIPLPGLVAPARRFTALRPTARRKRIWRSREDLVYALTFDHAGRLLPAPATKARFMRLTDNGEFADLLKASANQVTGFAPAPEWRHLHHVQQSRQSVPDGGFFATRGHLRQRRLRRQDLFPLGTGGNARPGPG